MARTFCQSIVVALVTASIALGVACLADDAAVAAETDKVSSNPLSSDPEAITEGKKLFTEHCTLCHGRKANGRTGRWKAADLRVFNKGYSRFVQIVKKGVKKKPRTNNVMQAWEKFLSDDQISQIGAYLETLSIRGAKWQDSD